MFKTLTRINSTTCRRLLILPAISLAIASMAGTTVAASNELKLKSPDGKIRVTIHSGDHLTYDVVFHHEHVVSGSTLGISVDGQDLGAPATFDGTPESCEINEQYPIMGGHDTATNHCLSSVIPLRSGNTKWQLAVKVFNDGVAYRYEIPGANTQHIDGESSSWNVPAGSRYWWQNAANTSYESKFETSVVGQSPAGREIMAPTTVQLPSHTGYAMLTEANLVNYSDMSLRLDASNSFLAFFRNSPHGWNNEGGIISPWRVTLLAPDLNVLVNSDLIKNLCPPPSPELAHATWIHPGRSAWGWLSCYCGPKVEEQHAWVDNTKALGWEYYLIDDGWKKWNGGGTNAWNALAEIVQYAKGKGVDIWLWVNAGEVFHPQDRLAYFQKAKSLGVVGLKIDFPKPANPVWVNWYEDCLKDAADAQLMVDFHGAIKPTGRERTWPNEVNREAVAGREQGKNPALHDTTLPFVRYVQGHADYTPTLFMPERLDGSSFAHELAMAIVYTAPFLCLGDNPEHYINSEARDVLQALPATWDETIVLPQSEIGQLAAFARRSGNQWFIGVINDQVPRQEKIKLSFLGKGGYRLVELADNAERNDAFARTVKTVTRKDTLTFSLRKDGGYTAWLVPVNASLPK
ncbi:MAG TPA: glycoside hydrolase family 97 catalytic domain-containing protein [Verrucomicrobiae bacterium]|jgi:alpha-glucosidase